MISAVMMEQLNSNKYLTVVISKLIVDMFTYSTTQKH